MRLRLWTTTLCNNTQTVLRMDCVEMRRELHTGPGV
jgi:hypothetical protein